MRTSTTSTASTASRLERAVYLLAHGGSPSLTEVALACGFSSSSDFSRSFRKHFGVPPNVFYIETYRRSGRARLEESVAAAQPPTTFATTAAGSRAGTEDLR